jgi:hypothetical protein
MSSGSTVSPCRSDGQPEKVVSRWPEQIIRIILTCNMALDGFCVRDIGVPCFVAISATNCPVEVS